MDIPFSVAALPSFGPLEFEFDSDVGPAGPAGATGAAGATGFGPTGPGCVVDPVLDNLFCGDSAGDMNTSGGHNTFLGDHSGPINTTAGFNTFVGADSGLSSSGTSNTFMGHSAGAANGGGTFNTHIGTAAGATTKASDNILIGAGAESRGTTASNELVLGSVSHPILQMEIGPNLDVVLPILVNPAPDKIITLFSFVLGLGETASMEATVVIQNTDATNTQTLINKYLFSAARNIAGTSIKTSPTVTTTTGVLADTAGGSLTLVATFPVPTSGLDTVIFSVLPTTGGMAAFTQSLRTRVVNLSLATKIVITPGP